MTARSIKPINMDVEIGTP